MPVSYRFDFLAYCVGNPTANTENRPPVMSQIPNYTAVVGTPVTFIVPEFTDPDSDQLPTSGQATRLVSC